MIIPHHWAEDNYEEIHQLQRPKQLHPQQRSESETSELKPSLSSVFFVFLLSHEDTLVTLVRVHCNMRLSPLTCYFNICSPTLLDSRTLFLITVSLTVACYLTMLSSLVQWLIMNEVCHIMSHGFSLCWVTGLPISPVISHCSVKCPQTLINQT